MTKPPKSNNRSVLRGQVVDLDAIAQKLGVSKTTVHYALARKGRVSEAVRKKILRLAEEMGYRPNLLARSLRTKRTQTVGVIFSSLSSSFHAHLLEAIDQAAQRNSYNIFLACSYRDADKERELFELMLSKGVEGVIAAPTSNDQYYAMYNRLASDGVPIVFVDRNVPESHIDCVSVDNFVGGRLAAEHLLSTGRKRMACVTKTHKGVQSTTLTERIKGFHYGLQTAGQKPAEILGLDVANVMTGEEAGFQAVSKALQSAKLPFDAIFTANDNLAYGAMRAILDAGLRIPADVAVVGFDDQDASAFVNPPLTTIRQPVELVGMTAVDILLKNLQNEEHATHRQPVRLRIEPKLVKRKSA
jgi:LacI family transcriptional regulator